MFFNNFFDHIIETNELLQNSDIWTLNSTAYSEIKTYTEQNRVSDNPRLRKRTIGEA